MIHPASTRRAIINFAGAGDNTVVAGIAGSPVRVYAFVFTVNGATNITFKDGANVLSGAFVLTGNGSNMVLPLSDEPVYETTLGNAFVINSTQAVQVSGTLWYTT